MGDTDDRAVGKKRYDLVFACSGACDVGMISDVAARKLVEDKIATMSCIAAIGAGIADLVEKAHLAGHIISIDGCSSECSRKILQKAGFDGFAHIHLESFGMEKGKTPASRDNVEKARGLAARELAARGERGGPALDG